MSNLENWARLEKPPATALKTISGGRLRGMTDVNPQWRYKAMTEVFGPCGQGWRYTIDRLWIENGVGDERVAFAQISLYAGCDIIPGIGGSMLIAKETGGLRTNDEAFKMAVTDALSVAMKMLGVASSIYEGRWDGTKYKDDADDKPKLPSAPITPTTGAKESITQEQAAKVDKIASEMLDMFNAGLDVSEPYAVMDNAGLTNEEKVYLWTWLDSKQRSALKKYHEALKKKRLETKTQA